tara:strand:+ start:573 stop:1397 length:825 start_codon:yes stop_codon:yes gene_type:complete
MKFFQLTRNERLGLVGISVVFSVLLVFKYFDSKVEVTYLPASIELKNNNNQEVFNSFSKKTKIKSTIKKQKSKSTITLKPFENFNPNTVTAVYWEKIGLKPKIAKRVNKFIKSGNGISKPSELLVIYGFKKEWLEDIETFLVFKKVKIDLNGASSEELQSVKGVGKVLAARIIKFRNKLGGFASSKQLYQVYGIDSISIDRSMDRFEIKQPWKKISINQASLHELESHLYLNSIQSEEIIKIRSITGEVDSVEVRNVFTTSEWTQIKPYFKWKN